ncbi:PRC-barrel domain containing protein [Streptomyces sp. AcE210]|uniref:PRC-barrel domain containing protein n=1 Tax=Streptomyces sp. AcE210 TaxID=2292703 RepID=UPI000E3002F9|nr:PRC-barrel domain containing protein [Streptomyces sp. AcE210]RFC75105.1 PRC-barrel domain containing protein [Streptomyces sp. AcE210]
MQSVWAYPAGIGYQGQEQAALTGFTLAASDGIVGQVERQVDESGMQHLVVDTGVWVFGKSVLIPAGVVVAIDTGAQTVTVTPTREEIKAAPRFTLDSQTTEPAYLAEVGNYYATLDRSASL